MIEKLSKIAHLYSHDIYTCFVLACALFAFYAAWRLIETHIQTGKDGQL